MYFLVQRNLLPTSNSYFLIPISNVEELLLIWLDLIVVICLY